MSKVINELSQDYISKFDTINIAKGGGLSNFSESINKLKMSNNNYLFVSLGGLGMETLARLKTEMARMIEIPEGDDKPKNVEFLAIDSDSNDIALRTRGGYNCDLRTEETFHIFNTSLTEIFKDPAKMDSSIKEWLDPRLPSRYFINGDGCGGFRQVGRFLIVENRLNLSNVINSKIQKLVGNNIGRRLIVYVICGIGGGTGSGTIIDATYLIRQVINNLGLANTKVGGCLMLADVQYSDIQSETTREYMECNNYAALKEINYFMGNPHYRMTYPGSFVVDSNARIFDTCVLLSGKREGLGTMAGESKDTCCTVLNNFLIDICTQSQLHQGIGNGGTSPIDSFLDNSNIAIGQTVANLSDTLPKNANFVFNVLGSASISLPTEQIYNYITYNTLDNLEKLWNSTTPSAANIDKILNDLNLHGVNLNHWIDREREIGFEYNANEYYRCSKEDVISGACAQAMKDDFEGQNSLISPELDRVRQKIVSEIVSNLNEKIQEIVQAWGLYYGYDFLNSSIEENGRINGLKNRLIKDIRDELRRMDSPAKDLFDSSTKQQEHIVDELKGRSLRYALKTDRSLIKSYVDLEIIKLKQKELMQTLAHCQIIVDEVIGNIDVKIQKIRRYVNSLDIMKITVKANKENSNIHLKSDYFDIENDKSLKAFIDSKLPNNDDDIKQLSISFLKHIFNQNEKTLWIGKINDYSPAKSLIKFIDSFYFELLNSSMGTYLMNVFGTNNYKESIEEMYSKLSIESRLLIHTEAEFPLDTLHRQDYVIVPASSNSLRNDIGKLAANAGITVCATAGNNKVTMLHWRAGVPLYALSNIIKYEKKYEKSIENGTNIGVHISSSDKENWSSFPILSNSLIYKLSEHNPREEGIRRDLEEKVQFSLKHGFIYKDPANMYKIHVISNYNKSTAQANCRAIFVKQTSGIKTIPVDNLDYYNIFETSGLFKFEDIEAFNGTSYLPQNVANLSDGIRMNMDTMKQLTETINLALDLKELFVDFNQKEEILTKRKENVKNFKEFYLYGMLKKIGDVWLYQSDKQSKEKLLVTITRMTVIQKEYDLYACYKRMFNEKEEPLLEQMEYMELLAYKKSFDIEIDNGNETIISQYNSASDIFVKECSEKNKKLNTFAEQRRFQDNDESELYNELLSFYQLLIA